jgi:ribulose-5-phosphate 4-epimerase/fuculose-1-phosphate aldolase
MSVFSEESLKLRRELAYACRILAANGQNDTVYGHLTLPRLKHGGFLVR